jgi:hypothetical protein
VGGELIGFTGPCMGCGHSGPGFIMDTAQLQQPRRMDDSESTVNGPPGVGK